MKKTLNKYKFIIIPFIIIYAFSMYVFFTKTTYELTATGYNSNVAETLYVGDDFEQTGSFHTTSVIVLNEISLYQKFLAEKLDKVDTEDSSDFYDSINLDEYYEATVLMKDDSMQTSLVVGITKANQDITYETNDRIYLTYSHLTPDTLKVGDYIVSVNGNEDINAEFANITCGETGEFLIIRDGEELTVYPEKSLVDDRCVFGFYLSPYTEIEETETEYTIYPTSSSGPSGGLMQSLFVYNQLTEFDYSRGLKVCGTGTIDTEGNVGYIGGVRQKIITSIGNDCDIYFIPFLDEEYEGDNYLEALATLEEFETDMDVYGVSHIDEAIAILEGYGEDNE